MITTTYRRFIDRLLALGILSPTRVDEARKGASDWDDLDEEFLPTAIGALLDELCVAAHVSYDQQDNVKDLESSYHRLLQRLAALDGSPVEITDLALDPEAAELRFRWDGKPVSWYVEPYALGSDEVLCLDGANLWLNVRTILPGPNDPRRLTSVDTDDGDAYLLLTEAQAEALRTEFDLPVQFVED